MNPSVVSTNSTSGTAVTSMGSASPKMEDEDIFKEVGLDVK